MKVQDSIQQYFMEQSQIFQEVHSVSMCKNKSHWSLWDLLCCAYVCECMRVRARTHTVGFVWILQML